MKLFLMLVALVLSSPFASASIKPKYGPNATRIVLSHEYLRRNPAPDYWVISPYYAAQRDDMSCSLASVTMIVNAARAFDHLNVDQKLATQDAVLKRTGDPHWRSDLGSHGKGVTLDELGRFALEALRAYGIRGAKIQVLHAEETPAFRSKLHALLVRNERSNRNFILANFIQGVYTGDAMVGHIAPVGAYDSGSHRVLVMDPDREWYSPYWVSEKIFLKGLATKDEVSKKTRGIVWIQLPAAH